jgi:hypothetical protein
LIFKFLTIFIFFTIGNAQAFDKDFTTVNDRVPHEFNLLFDALKLEIKTPSEKLRMIGLCKELNDNLGFLQKEHIFMLMKTEVIKGTLEFRFDKVRQFDMNDLLLARLEREFESKKAYLNGYARWIWQSVIAELHYRKKLGLISAASFNPANFDGQKKAEAMRFQRYLNYLFPWIDKMDSLDAASFNQTAKEVSWFILQRINERSILFKRYASSATSSTQTVVINIPQKLLELKPEDIKRMKSDQPPLSLAEQAKKEKAKASESMESITPLDMSTMSDDVAKELEKKTQPKP